MRTGETVSIEEALALARMLVEADDVERVELLHRLRQNLKLTRAVRGFNTLIEQPFHRVLGSRALKSIGLDKGG